MSRQKPRKVDAGTVMRGDLVRATWYEPDHVRTVEARVGAIIYSGTQRHFKTEGGALIYEWNLGSELNPFVELIDAVPVDQEQLAGFDHV